MLNLPLLNPVRFKSTSSNYEFDHNLDFCYFQKWQLGDVLNLQFLSTSALTLRLQNVDTGRIEKTYNSIIIPNGLIDADFETHEFSIKFDTSINYGRYRFLLSAVGVSRVFPSEPFSYLQVQENTILLKYRNSKNSFNVIFDTGIEYYFRVEGTVKLFEPRFDSVVYVDQKRDSTLLSATPYRIFSLIVGTGRGVPDWAIDLFSKIACVNEKQVDRLKFEIEEGASVEVQRSDNYAMSAASLEITEKNNPYVQEFRDLKILGDNEGNAITTNGGQLNITE